MPLHCLPYDVYFELVSYLDFEDVINLARTCRQLSSLVKEETLCRKVIRDHAGFSQEGKLAEECSISYPEAVIRFHRRRRAFGSASPQSVKTVAQGSDFLYRQGVLCVLNDSNLSVKRIHSGPALDNTWDLSNYIPINSPSSEDKPSFALLYYSHEIAAIRYYPHSERVNSQILAFEVKSGLVLGAAVLPDCETLFVRHNNKYLYYGTHTARGEHGFNEWLVQGISLHQDYPIPRKTRLQLRDFVGSDIGTTVVFCIHEDHFYALSNQTSFDIEEVDWTSFYHCVRFPLDNPRQKKMKVSKEIFRRQHEEGSVNDAWTDLGFQVDEKTNELLIVEGRREWEPGTSLQTRKFYIRDIPFSEVEHAEDSDNDIAQPAGHLLSVTALQLHPTDRLSALAGSGNNTHYAPTEKRDLKNVHQEIGPGDEYAVSFIPSKTKHRSYNLSARSFLDLVEDSNCCTEKPGCSCLRLRIGMRYPKPLIPVPDDEDTECSKRIVPLVPTNTGAEPFRYDGIRLWPPPAASSPRAAEIHKIMNPGSPYTPQETVCISDERSLVFMRRPTRPRCEADKIGQIVLISFDQNILVRCIDDSQAKAAEDLKGKPSPERRDPALETEKSADLDEFMLHDDIDHALVASVEEPDFFDCFD